MECKSQEFARENIPESPRWPIWTQIMFLSRAWTIERTVSPGNGTLPNSVRSTIADKPWRFHSMRMRDLIHDVTAGRSATAVGDRVLVDCIR
jgi:hypothetical protein